MEAPKNDKDLQAALLELVKQITDTFEIPEHWPMTEEERGNFLRRIYYHAHRIKNSEPYLRARLMEAASRLPTR